MDFEEFKEQFAEDVKNDLEGKGIDASVKVNSVEKMNENYDALTDYEQMYVASVPDKVHGAGIIAYQNFMDQAAERAGGDFYILPSSIHEVLIVPDTGAMKLADLEAMVKEVSQS